MSFLYVIAAREQGPTKLGISDDPARRLKQLQTGHPETLMIFHKEAVDAPLAYYLERNLHKSISHRRLRGEWFDLAVAEAISHIIFTLIHYEPSELVLDMANTPIGSPFPSP